MNVQAPIESFWPDVEPDPGAARLKRRTRTALILIGILVIGCFGLASLLNVGGAVVGSGVAGLAASYKGFALAIGDVPYAGIYPIIDTQHIVPGGGPDNGLQFNETGLYLAGALSVMVEDSILTWSHRADSLGDLPGANLIFDALAAPA